MDLTTQIKKALKKAGLDEALAEKIKVTEESQIEAEIEKLKEIKELAPEQLIEALKEAGLEESYKKHLQSEVDRRVTQAITTHDLKLAKEKEEATTKAKTEEEKKKEQANMSDNERQISNLTEEVKSLTGLVKTLGESTVKTKRETLIKNSLKEAGLNEGFSKYITVDKDEDINESVKSLKDDVLGLKQAEIDKKLKDGDTPPKGEPAGSVEEEEAVDFAKTKNDGAKGQPFEGFDEAEIKAGEEIKK
jgi:aminopeptidase N